MIKVGTVIVIAHQKGGVGKSTIASNLAVEISKTTKVILIDLDIQRSISYFNSLREDNKLEIKHANKFNDLQELVNNNSEVMIIDVGGFDSDLNRAAILGADILVTPVSDSAIELVGLLSFKNTLKEVRNVRPDIRASILLNRIHPNARLSIEKLNDFIRTNDEFSLLNSVLRDRSEYKKAFEVGKSVCELDEHSKAAAEIKQLVKEVYNG
jgi:chromosome partitioning protein